MSRTVSPAAVSSTISNGGVSAREKIVSASAFTSISPVGEVGVLVAAALDDDARDADAEFAAQLAGQPVGLGVGPRFEHHLGEAAAIAQVDEHAAAVVAARRHPAEQDRALAGVAPAQRRRSHVFA